MKFKLHFLMLLAGIFLGATQNSFAIFGFGASEKKSSTSFDFFKTYMRKGVASNGDIYCSCEIEAYESVHEKRGARAGKIDYSYIVRVDDTNDCSINRLLVEEAFRNKGIGTKLLKIAIGKMVNHGCEEVRWYAYPFRGNLTQEQLNAFYSKRGGVKLNDENEFAYKLGPQHLVKRENLMAMLRNQGDLFAPDSN
jgi:GNAT superfamily N-acetyltransferase